MLCVLYKYNIIKDSGAFQTKTRGRLILVPIPQTAAESDYEFSLRNMHKQVTLCF